MAATNHTRLQMLRMMQSEKSAVESQMKELTMEALTQQNSQLTHQNEVQIAFDFSCVSTRTSSECVVGMLRVWSLG